MKTNLSRTGRRRPVFSCGLPAAAIIFLGLLFQAPALHAQEDGAKYFSLMGGVGTSDILVKGASFGLVLDTNFLFMPPLAAGVRGGVNFSTDGITSVEGEVYARWYFWRPYIPFIIWDNIAVFAQGGIGLLTAYKGMEAPNSRASMLFDGAIGVNIPLDNLIDRLSIEPSVRFGYPFIAGFSLSARYRFPSLAKTTTRTEYRDVEIQLPPKELTPNEIIRKIIISQWVYIRFAGDSPVYNDEKLEARFRSDNEEILNQIAKILRDNPEFRLRIEGHANPTGVSGETAQELQRLSAARANAIFNQLIRRGVQEEQMVVIAHGGTRTITSQQEAWELNRRVELMVIQVNTAGEENSK